MISWYLVPYYIEIIPFYTMSFCGKCGSKNLDDSRFCKQCGSPLDVDQPDIIEPVQESIKTENPSEQPKDDGPNYELFPGLQNSNSTAKTEEKPVEATDSGTEDRFYESVENSMSSGSCSRTDFRGDTIIVSKVTKTDLQNTRNKAYVCLIIGLLIMVFAIFVYKFPIYLYTKDVHLDITEATLYSLLSDGVIGLFDVPNPILMLLILGGLALSVGGFASAICSSIGCFMFFIGFVLMSVMKYPINIYITEVYPKISVLNPDNMISSAILPVILLIAISALLSASSSYMYYSSSPEVFNKYAR